MKARFIVSSKVIILISVMGFISSCRKEKAEPETGDFSLSLQEMTTLKQYAGHETVVRFSITVNGSKNPEMTVTTSGPGTAKLDYSFASAAGFLNMSLDKNAQTDLTTYITLSGYGKQKKYTVVLSPYYFKGEIKPVYIDGEVSSRATVDYSINTNLDRYEVKLDIVDKNYFALEGEEIVALRSNVSGEERTTQIILKESTGTFAAICGVVMQKSLPTLPPEEIVHFEDQNFKTAMVEVADTNLDGEVSLDEALQITEINVAGKSIKNLTGIEAFKNVWKLDAQNNDIVDATVIKELHALYWLDLKGNKRLVTFDVTGCTLYFEHCEFEVTDQLVYYTTRQQIQVTNASDLMSEHSRHVLDPRETTDWSNQDEIVLLKGHTEGKGYPFILTGVSYLDVDMKDGSFMRLMKDVLEAMVQYEPLLKEYSQYIDFYAVKHKAVNRNQYYIDADDCTVDSPLVVEISDKVNEDQIALFEKIYKEFDSEPQSTNAVLPVFVEINPLGTPSKPWNASYFPDVLTKKGFVNAYYLHTYMDNQNESCFTWTYSQTIEMMCYKWQNGYTSYDKDYLETYVKK